MKRLTATLLQTISVTGFTAQQGITIAPRFAYCTSNIGPSYPHQSFIYRLDRITFALLASNSIQSGVDVIWPGVSTYTCHIGQCAINPADGFLYATFMDPVAIKTALLKFDPVTLALVAAIDFTPGGFTYLDALAFSSNDGRIWINRDEAFQSFIFSKMVISSGGVLVLDLPNRDAWAWAFYLYDKPSFGCPQGLQVTDQVIYVVPENDPSATPPDTPPQNNGIIGFYRSQIQHYVGSHAPINDPDFIWPFQVPSPGNADHEAFAFDGTNPNCIWIPTAADNGASLWKFQVQPLPTYFAANL